MPSFFPWNSRAWQLAAPAGGNNARTDEADGERGIGLVTLAAVAVACMAVTAAVVIKVASK